MTNPSKVLVVDDHPLFREALSTAVTLAYPATKPIEAGSIDEALDYLETDHGFDIALVDLKIPGVSGFDGLLQLRTRHPRLPILVVSGLEDHKIVSEAIKFGAAGFVPKSVGRETLAEAMEQVLQGGVYLPSEFSDNTQHASEANADHTAMADRVGSLTPQQMRVLSMLREGLLNKQIAHELQVGSSTIKKHVSEILRKLQVHSRTQAVIEVAKLEQDGLFTHANSLSDTTNPQHP